MSKFTKPLTTQMHVGGSKIKFRILTDFELGKAGPSGVGLSSLRKKASEGQAKLNAAALALDLLLSGNLNAAFDADTKNCYVEFKDGTGNLYKASAAQDQKISFDQEPPADALAVVPAFIHAVLNAKNAQKEGALKVSGYEHTLESFEDAACDALSHTAHSADNLYLLCDSYYFETKENWGFLEAEFNADNAIIGQARQSVRTGRMILMKDMIPVDFPYMEMTVYTDNLSDESPVYLSCSEKYEQIKRGNYVLEHFRGLEGFERQKYIPKLETLEDFVPGEEFFALVDLISYDLGRVAERMNDSEYGYGPKAIGENYVNALMVGRPGTGKTTIANALGAAFGMPVRVVTSSKFIEEDEFQGKNKFVHGQPGFVETPFLDVYKNGGIILLEEFNLADPGVTMGALGQAIEKPFILLEDGYREVHRHPLCVVIATMNVGTQGAREPSEALTSRMPNTFVLDDPTETQFKEILIKKSGADKTTVNKVYNTYRKILSYLAQPSVNAEDVALSITLRHCLAALKQIETGRTFKQAVKGTMIGAIAIKDLDLSRTVESDVLAIMPE